MTVCPGITDSVVIGSTLTLIIAVAAITGAVPRRATISRISRLIINISLVDGSLVRKPRNGEVCGQYRDYFETFDNTASSVSLLTLPPHIMTATFLSRICW